MSNKVKCVFPIKEGFLTKEGRQFKTLRLRWLVLYDDLLEYYETQNVFIYLLMIINKTFNINILLYI